MGQNSLANPWETMATESALCEVGSEELKARPLISGMTKVEKKLADTLLTEVGLPCPTVCPGADFDWRRQPEEVKAGIGKRLYAGNRE